MRRVLVGLGFVLLIPVAWSLLVVVTAVVFAMVVLLPALVAVALVVKATGRLLVLLGLRQEPVVAVELQECLAPSSPFCDLADGENFANGATAGRS